MGKYTIGHIVSGSTVSMAFPCNQWQQTTALYIPKTALIYYSENKIDGVYFDSDSLRRADEKVGGKECLGQVKLPSGWVDKVIASAKTLQEKEGKNLVERINKLLPVKRQKRDIPNDDY